MIIKVQASKDRNKWWLMDNLAKVRFQDRADVLEDGEGFKEGAFDIDLRGMLNEYDNRRTEYSVMVVRDRDGKETSVLFDGVAYIMNDQGETVEKVVGNLEKEGM